MMADGVTADDDDIFARLGSEFLTDLMADLSKLDSLEIALDEHERSAPVAALSTTHLHHPISLLSRKSEWNELATSSAASVVVSHQTQRQAQELFSHPHSSPNNNGTTAILNFDSLAAHEFLMADSAKKNKQPPKPAVAPSKPFAARVESIDSEDGVDTAAARNLVNSLLLDDEEEYNIDEEPPKFVATTARPAAAATDTQKAAKSLLAMLQQKQPEPQQQQQQQQPIVTMPIVPPQPPQIIAGNGTNVNVALPTLGMPGMRLSQQQLMQHHQLPPMPSMQHSQQQFPASSSSQPNNNNNNNNNNKILPPSKPRILFNNPHVTRVSPIPAHSVASLLMTSRDILYVVHTMIRPLLPLVENPYDNDYYFQIFTERQGMAPAEKPAWKDEKQHIAGKELHFRQVVVERAKDWKDDKQTLGHVVRSDVKRPRALVASPVLNKMVDESSSSNEEYYSQRAQLWRSRALVDKGYQAHLELVEAQRTLRTNISQERGQELIQDVKYNIALLHSCFGLSGSSGHGEGELDIDVSTLRACLSLTKGQELVARCMEERSLPHASACVLLPHIICILFTDARPATISEVAIAKEERLCRSLTVLVLLRNPSVGKEKLLQSLEGMVNIAVNLKKVLGYAARAGVMHAVLSRGGEMYIQATDATEESKAKWLLKEMDFKNLLSSA